MKRRIYIYQENFNNELVDLFNNLSDNIFVEEHKNNILTVMDQDFYNPEPIDIESIRELIEEDFGGELIMFIEPYKDSKFDLEFVFNDFLSELPKGIYFLEDIIPYLVLKNKTELKKRVISYINSLVNKEVIHTVREFIENNMNSSLSAKKLYMHRNTLNYRIENFIDATKIDVKTFKGANAIYMLYKF